MEKVALITGASRGIGSGCARSLHAAGYKIAIHYRSGVELANKLKEELPGSLLFGADLTNPDECQNLVKAVKNEMGRIDVLVNNAGVSIDQVITFAKPADFDKLISTNLKPVFLLSKLVSRIMIKQKGGRIINLSSVVGYTGNGGQSMYATTKAGITGFTKSLAIDLAGAGITANCVAPGFISTDMTDSLSDEVKEAILAKIPLKRLGTPKEIGAAIKFLASEEASYITGSTIHVNGGMHTS